MPLTTFPVRMKEQRLKDPSLNLGTTSVETGSPLSNSSRTTAFHGQKLSLFDPLRPLSNFPGIPARLLHAREGRRRKGKGVLEEIPPRRKRTVYGSALRNQAETELGKSKRREQFRVEGDFTGTNGKT